MFILVIELIFGSWLKDTKKTDIVFVPRNIDRKIPIKHKYPSNKNFIHYRRDMYGFRGDYDSINQIKILTVGGSTTDQINVSEDETWSYIIQNNFLNAGKNIYVANAGVMGQTTFGHIENFNSWFNHIPDLKPDYFLFYIGINDFYKRDPAEYDKHRYGSKKA